MSRFRGLDTDEGWIRRELAGLSTQIRELSSAKRLVVASASAQYDADNLSLPTGWGNVITQSIPVPEGYTQAIVQVFASAGVTVAGTGSGNVGVQAGAQSGTLLGGATVLGPALSMGKTGGGAVSVNAALAAKVPVTSANPLVLTVSAYASGDPAVSGSGNVHLSATVMFIRG